MAGNPNWWSINDHMRQPSISQLQPSSTFLFPTNNSSTTTFSPSLFSPHYANGSPSLIPFNSILGDNQGLPHQSWSQLLMGGLGADDEDKICSSQFQSKKLENWEDHILNSSTLRAPSGGDHNVKEEVSLYSYTSHGDHHQDEFRASKSTNWSQIMQVSSPRSCVTSLGTNMLDFSNNNNKSNGRNQHQDQSECNSTANVGVYKKARVQSSSSQSQLKVRKEKLGDRITALHQLVSPFGKTDTASVLLEAIGYIRFLQGQIEALSSPYLAGNTRNQLSVQGERNCTFPEDPGQLLNDACLKRRGSPNQENQDAAPKDLRSRGLCLVPVSCTQHIGNDNGADYWASTLG
ncbi:hypothetical protein RJ641_024134, partial [Dillenia turbinata]